MITIRIVAFAFVAAPLVLLGGCQAAHDLTTVGDAQNAVSKTAAAVTTIKSTSASTLSKAQAAACAGQALANTVTDMLTGTGHIAAAANSAAVSAALGSGCSWTLAAL
jgi:hypothetical protein